ncbi:hypothetical protein NC653_015597 [Populus alba x Populus x berolinensis]|uniref:Uncharacterized protein n=1 Tax=Populus alba x Populus x berolinensis TaxID=444605 RepID=A0AAD6QKY9_9ROSI|nr:hypothetical protein NC653_015198 [Populus alba x Populus x berolinensis]KAJ6992277.1 hypothetical protein NC653_015597 [Populus alba x Populus x berolinensis]
MHTSDSILAIDESHEFSEDNLMARFSSNSAKPVARIRSAKPLEAKGWTLQLSFSGQLLPPYMMSKLLHKKK